MKNTKKELLSKELAEVILKNIDAFEADAEKTADSKAIKIIEEIRDVLEQDKSDFDAIEEIVNIFEKNGIDTNCHAF